MRLLGLVYRAHNPRWAFSPVCGEAAARHGGRFNPRGMPALYTSLSVECAWREAQQALPFKAGPMTICAYEVDCDDLADLTDPVTAAALGVDEAVPGCAWEARASRWLAPPSWDLARQLLAGGTAGIVVPSFAPGARADDRNLVLWRWAEAGRHRVEVLKRSGARIVTAEAHPVSEPDAEP